MILDQFDKSEIQIIIKKILKRNRNKLLRLRQLGKVEGGMLCEIVQFGMITHTVFPN